MAIRMDILWILMHVVAGLAGLLVSLLLLYLVLRLLTVIGRTWRVLNPPPDLDKAQEIARIRHEAEQAMDEVSKEFLDDIYRQALRDWSRF